MEEYHIVYWENPDDYSQMETISLLNEEKAIEEYERILNGGKIINKYENREIEPFLVKLTKTVRGFHDKYDDMLTPKGKKIFSDSRGTGEHFVNTVDSIAEEKKAQDSIKDCFKTKGYPTT